MTKYYPGDIPCGRCEGAILPSEHRFRGIDDNGDDIVLCQECHENDLGGIPSHSDTPVLRMRGLIGPNRSTTHREDTDL
jgi:hypothetical protein